jgi:hypothetical protein
LEELEAAAPEEQEPGLSKRGRKTPDEFQSDIPKYIR